MIPSPSLPLLDKKPLRFDDEVRFIRSWLDNPLSTGAVMTTVAGMGTKALLVREIAADPSRGPRLIGASLYLRTFMIGPALHHYAWFFRLLRENRILDCRPAGQCALKGMLPGE